MLEHFKKLKIFTPLFCGVVVFVCAATVLFTGVFAGIDETLQNSLYRPGIPSKDIVIITIDDKSVSPAPTGLGLFSKWSRRNQVLLLQALKSESPKVIAYDILFHTNSTEIPKDEFLNLKSKIAEVTDPIFGKDKASIWMASVISR